MIKSTFLIFSLLLASSLYGQLYNGLARLDQTWILGSSSDPTTDRFGLTRIDFDETTSAIKLDTQISEFDFDFSNLSFTWNDQLYSGNHCVLVRGLKDTVAYPAQFDTTQWKSEYCDRNLNAGMQSVLPLNHHEVYYVTERYLSYPVNAFLVFTTSLVFSKLNTDSIGLFLDTTFFIDFEEEYLWETFDFTSNGSGGWYGVVKSAVNNDVHLVEITEDTIAYHGAHAVGSTGYIEELFGTRLKFNPSGTAFGISGGTDGVGLYYFDINTKEINEWITIPYDFDPNYDPDRFKTDCEWSADGRYFYVTAERSIFQFDTHAADITASVVKINDPDIQATQFGYFEIERGPDCRLYIGWPGSGRVLSVIDKPSRPGRACELKPGGFLMPTVYYVSLPNYQNYAQWGKDRIAMGLPPLVDTAVCDSSLASVEYFDWLSSSAEERVPQWKVFPNPARSGDQLNFQLPAILANEPSLQVKVYATNGKLVQTSELAGLGDRRSFALYSSLAAGVYLLQLEKPGVPLGSLRVEVH